MAPIAAGTARVGHAHGALARRRRRGGPKFLRLDGTSGPGGVPGGLDLAVMRWLVIRAGILVDDLDEWLAGLWEGKTRSVTLLVGSSVVAGLYALASRGAAPADRR